MKRNLHAGTEASCVFAFRNLAARRERFVCRVGDVTLRTSGGTLTSMGDIRAGEHRQVVTLAFRVSCVGVDDVILQHMHVESVGDALAGGSLTSWPSRGRDVEIEGFPKS